MNILSTILESIINLIKKNGVGTVLIAVILIIILSGLHVALKIAEKNLDNFVLTPNDPTPMSINTVSQYNLQIQGLLQQMLHRYNADRVYIMEYHNGEHNSIGIPFYYQSCRYQKVGNNASPQILHLQRIPISLNTKFHFTISNNQIVHLNVQKDVSQQTRLYYTGRDIKTIIASGIYDSSNNTVGYLALNFNKDEVYCDQVKKQQLIKYSIRISQKMQILKRQLQQVSSKHLQKINKGVQQ